ncbi:fungal zn(2)-Cys(6) binuclear cluster domain-containing protein [Rhizoctonia solani AG-1 IA]|uniref:Fungal zn(2)-Cys(6) binuclear cluster domain-containing protein n=1 Tax=Thanatephorus cucumeris (strain AG1-IA) TaxID=983506 RepID=L8X1J6_THACA|nr:fungal zn(2)-Cys(6) binuclear cluster domain-containing protein [Rhizoctonia solani AG-1 IA]
MKHTPGPLPSSCLTCRQRRKKCDKNRPACDRCLVGGFRCLGYDHIPTSSNPKQPRASTSKQAATSSLRAPSIRDPKNRLGSPGYNSYRHSSTDSGTSDTGDLSPRQLSSMHTTPAARGLSYSYSPELSQPSCTSAFPTPRPVSAQSPQRVTQAGYLSSPISSECPQSSMALAPKTVFGPPRPPVIESSPVELQELPNETWAQPLFSMIDTYGGSYNPSFVFNLPPTISPNPLFSGQIIDFILAQCEIMVFFRPTREMLDFARQKLIVRLQESNLTHWSMYIGARIFQALMKYGKRADLRFLEKCVQRMGEHVCSQTTRDGSLTGALHALSGGLECNGLPGSIHPTEWMHGSPIELTALIIKISLWRAKHPDIQCAPESTWKPLEIEAWAWAPRVASPGALNEPNQMVIRMAVQEGWRHAGLIYLYMRRSARPGLGSPNRTAVTDSPARSDYEASICTPSEKHRTELRNAFVKVEEHLPWLFRALDYRNLVDHLWHGAAAGGKPVRWEDYINSRRAVMPID